MAVRFGEYVVGGEPYTYHLTFESAPGGVRWRAIVRDGGGALLCMPKGVLATAAGDEVDDRLRGEVTRAIDLTVTPSER